VKIRFLEHDKQLRIRLEQLSCAEHLLSGKGRPCEKPIILFCGSCRKPIKPDDIQYHDEPPFYPCPHGCNNNVAEYKKRCALHQAAWEKSRDRRLCEVCGKDHPNPGDMCFFTFFYEQCCLEEEKWRRDERVLQIKCIKEPPKEYVEWLDKRMTNKCTDKDDWDAILLIDAFQSWNTPDWLRERKIIMGNLARGRRSQIAAKRPPGRWRPRING
jgi:hypothetical protein